MKNTVRSAAIASVFVASLSFGSFVGAAAPAEKAAVQAPVLTPQQLFDAASASAAEGNCTAAVAQFDALQARVKLRTDSILAGAVAVRKGGCLAVLGREAEASLQLQAGLPILTKAGDAFAGDVVNAHRTLGKIALRRWDYATAADQARQALALLNGAARYRSLLDLALATMFEPDDEALHSVDEALAIARSRAQTSQDDIGTLLTLRGRALFNHGRAEEAYRDLKEALQLKGGYTLKVALDDIATRSDLAIAATMTQHYDDARKATAYTGAGRLADTPFALARAMPLPACGSVSGLKPEDFAVVEFSLGDDGFISAVQPVYSPGGAAAARAFAGAVANWTWAPESIKDIKPFFRVLTRVEVRCSSAEQELPGLMAPMDGRFFQWADASGSLKGIGKGDIRSTIQSVRQRLAEAEKNDDKPGQVALTGRLLVSPTELPDYESLARTAFDRGVAAGVPDAALNWLKIRLALLGEWDGRSRLDGAAKKRLLALLTDPTIERDAMASATVRLLAARTGGGWNDSAKPLLLQVAGDSRLPAGDPLRQIAFLRLAYLAASSGDVDGAQGWFAQTGLTEEQCVLVGVRPARRSTPGEGFGVYPQEALQLGFAGWVKTEFDLDADGVPKEPRAVVAYPPFLFDEAATRMVRRARYERSYRPSGGMSCRANQERVNFRLNQGL